MMILRLNALIVCLLLSAIRNVQPQDPSLFADARLYDATLERVLQHDVQPRSAEIQLRYTYCDAGEMQIVTHRLSNADFRVETWFVPAGSPTLWDQLAKAATSQPRLTPEDAAGLMRIARKTIVVPRGTSLGSLVEGAEALSIPVVNRDLAVLEGMQYGFALHSPTEEMNLTMMAPQSAEKSEYALIRWMGRVRANVESLLKRQ